LKINCRSGKENAKDDYMLKIALPNKGLLAEPAQQMLREAGYLKSHHPRDLEVQDPDNNVQFFFLRPRDIAVYVAAGTLDLGITGKDMVADSGVDVDELMSLGFGNSTFRLAAPNNVSSVSSLENKRIATSYPGLLNAWLISAGLKAFVVQLDGAVENAVKLGVADAVADVVDTGTTMQQAGLKLLGEPILTSEAILIRRKSASDSVAIETFERRINSVILARDYVLVDYDIPSNLLDAACLITPGFESPTISALKDSNWSAVRAMVPVSEVHQVMDSLYQAGARGILVTEIAACRL
jgi:ATP phosphoribosyltransferase